MLNAKMQLVKIKVNDKCQNGDQNEIFGNHTKKKESKKKKLIQ